LCEYASRYVVDAEADNVVQEFMIWLWENHKTLIVTSSLKGWLFACVRYACLNVIRQQDNRRRVMNAYYETMKDRFEDPDYYLSDELAREIRRAVDGLPQTYRETFVRSRFSAMTNVEIASELGVSVKTVEYRITQSLRILRQTLKEWL